MSKPAPKGIAKAADVSAMTVSKVLNGKPGVSEALWHSGHFPDAEK